MEYRDYLQRGKTVAVLKERADHQSMTGQKHCMTSSNFLLSNFFHSFFNLMTQLDDVSHFYKCVCVCVRVCVCVCVHFKYFMIFS